MKKKQMKKKKTTTKRKVGRRKPVAPLRIPKEMKPFILRKFKSKDRSRRFLVVRLPKDEGCAVQVFTRKTGTSVVREFRTPPPSQSGVPVPVTLEVNREMAIFWARSMARKGQPPSEDKERRRRRRYLRKSLKKYADHITTKMVVDKLKGRQAAALKKPTVKMPFICFYNPLARKKEAVFTIHKAHCAQLDAARRRTHKKGGTSWVVEALTADEAMRLQLEEFTEEGKGYIGADFDVHNCGGGQR